MDREQHAQTACAVSACCSLSQVASYHCSVLVLDRDNTTKVIIWMQ